MAPEHRDGYRRDLYKHWNRGLNASDGCDTRKEVILSEAVEAPHVAAGCKLTGGSWRSAYDNLIVTDAARLDVDHLLSAPPAAGPIMPAGQSVSSMQLTLIGGSGSATSG
ncbi:hypothetical protein ACFW7J_35520 [Streptomyces sp. NPDC059525]|uniref:hypothetical protein n=1 Tax=Streptomyces sp. NPDC059525 TaxID=3346857 RepID=UPI003687B8D0